MNRTSSKTVSTTAEQILSDLSTRQFLKPRAGIYETLMVSAGSLGFCPRAAEHVLRWLEVDSSKAIGRLRRTELTQLSHSIYRFWQRVAQVRAKVAEATPH